MQHVFKATEEGPVRVKAQVYQLDFDGGKLAVFREQHSPYLSHYASGQILCRLSVVQLAKYRPSEIIQESLDDLVRQMGADKVRDTLQAAPTINP